MIRGNLNRLILLLLLAVSFQFACKSSTVKPDEALTHRIDTPAFFHNIPADSPYVITGTEPVPLEIVKNTMAQLNTMLDTTLKLYDEQISSAESSDKLQNDVALRAFLAFFQELRGNISPEGLNSLGLSMQPSFAFYGIGPLPVYRMSLHDSSAFEAFLQRIESAARIEVEHHSLQSVPYRVYRYENTIFPVAIQGNEVIVGVTNARSADVYLPYMLGTKRPKHSLADNNQIKEIIKTYGLRPFIAGFVDLVGLSDMFLQHRVSGSVMDEIMQVLELDQNGFEQPSEACRQEIRAALADMPRLVMGYEGFSAKEVQAMFALEFKSSFASRLDQTRAPIPAMELHNSNEVMASLGLGIDLQKFVEFLSELSQQVQQAPYVCEDFEWINTSTAQLQELSSMIPPFVADLRGFSGVLKTMSLGSMGVLDPVSVDAVAILNSVNPSGLLQTLAMFAAFIDPQEIEDAEGTPVAIEGLEEIEFLVAPHIAKNSTAIGMSVGVGMQDEMAVVMEDKSIVASPLVIFSYNYSKFAELLGETGGYGDEMAELFEAYTGFINFLGKSTVSLDAGPNALFMRYAIELKPSTP